MPQFHPQELELGEQRGVFRVDQPQRFGRMPVLRLAGPLLPQLAGDTVRGTCAMP
jgi:hypothetical protein